MLGTKVHIKDDRQKWDRMVKRSDDFGKNKNTVGIGLFTGKTKRAVIERGTGNEFGVNKTLPNGRVIKIPRRSFLRGWLIAFENRIQIFFFEQYVRYILGKQSLAATMKRLGLFGVAGVVGRIALGKDFKPNAPITIKKKGHTRVLEDTGEMIKNITRKWMNKK